VYLDDSADPEMAVRIADNAKTQRYGTCNTMETLLVAESIAPKVLPRIGTIFKSKNVEMRGDSQTQKLIPEAKAATEKDYYTEWLAPIVSIRVVKGLDEAIEHIAKYGSQHTDAIVAGDRAAMLRLAIEGEPLYEIDARELALGASGYTADTLRELSAGLEPETALYLLLGADQYAKLATWHQPQEVARRARIAVFSRPG